MKTRFFAILMMTLLSFVFWATAVTPSHALTPTPAFDEPIPMPVPWQMDGLRIEYQRVDVTLSDQIATTHIDQLFVNDNDWNLEGTYLFPLPEGAAVSQLTMWVDGTPIEAKILGHDEARQIYDEIVRQLRDPALLEYVGNSTIQANIFPIPPHSQRRIEIEYNQILPAENGLIHYVYPQSSSLYTNIPLDSQSIRVEVSSKSAIRAIYSPSHAIDVSRDGEFAATAGFEGSSITPDTDFELYYTVSPETIGLNLLTYRESGEDGFFLLLVAPSLQVSEVVAKDVILVLDTSGSMEGDKMSQAQAAAQYVVSHLNPTDRFNIISFGTGVRRYADALVSASNPGSYQAYINSLESVGGTNISMALLEAIAQADPTRPTTIIFVTDGLATEGIIETPALLTAVAQAASANVRLFSFGVGDDVDTTLLTRLAEEHRGTTSFVRPFQNIQEEVSGFYAKISMPVLSDISLDFGGMVVDQLYPDTLPDLFAGTQLVLVGRYRDGGPASITLRGSVNGREQVFTYPDQFFRIRSGDDFIPRLWATRAIGNLLTQIQLNGENQELVQSVVNLSIRYGIITPYTSYLIQEEDIFSQTGRQGIVDDALIAPPVTNEVSGSEAVNQAAAAGGLAAADAPMPMATSESYGYAEESDPSSPMQQTVKIVGSKTFVWRDGRWTDTAYNSDTQIPQALTFASPAYFDLLATNPELGQYFALGSHVLVVYDGTVYETTEDVVNVINSIPSTATATATRANLFIEPTPTRVTALYQPTPISPITLTPNTTSSNGGGWGWAFLLGIPILFGVGLWIGRRNG